MNDIDLNLAKKVACDAVRAAGDVVMRNFGSVAKANLKKKSDLVTEIDVQAERIILDKIKDAFSDHTIVSEESGIEKGESEYMWIVDPIDGTINYFYGNAPVRIGVCLLKNKKGVLTAVYNPIKDELYFAQRGKGAFCNERKIHVSENTILQDAVVMTHLSSDKIARGRMILSLDNIFKHTMHMRIFGCGLASMSYVASGRFDIFLNVLTNPWDILPGVLLIEEAGGKVTDIHGKAITEDSTSVLATNGHVHKQVLELLEDI